MCPVSAATFVFPYVIVFSVFWGGREGFHSVLNTDVAAELKHMASFFRMAVGKCVHDFVINKKLIWDVPYN